MDHKGKHSLIFAISILILIISIGIFGYTQIEGYSFVEALYMTIITIGTVGFKEVHPLSTEGMLFTTFLIVISIGFFAYGASFLARYFSDRILARYSNKYIMEKQIAKLRNHVIVVGYGRNGSQAVDELIAHNIPVVVIENRPKVIEYIKENPKILYVDGDATDDNTLRRAGINHAKAVITALANDADNLFVVITAREMNSDLLIISRASAIANDKKLKLAGADNVILPDKVGGQKMAKLVIQPDILEFVENIMLKRTGEVSLFEISCESMKSTCGKTIQELGIREKTGANILGAKTSFGEYILNPPPNYELTPDTMLFVLGTNEQIENLKKILS
ncbi:MAG: voltage-gated potassium channel [Tenuifilum sp.]|jgi:voltage-gated potassium channel|uniref:potassium channel family protein n=1 Tax=Tenuifilum sp. TaxID=2760880 RepID=UPI0024AB410C|nr:potassium channel protein [Tenuifilum sp.]MDI3527824.1 voltage-gated potassium channel [Tenuifilum sp.]